jgi:hypothetical protein
MRLLLIGLGLLALLSLCGCAKDMGGSVSGGECKIFERPPYAVQGMRRYDQDWIDSQVEGGVGACGWQRPAARPPELDAQPTLKPTPKPVRKRSVLRKIKDKVWPRAAVAPVTAAPALPDRPVADDAPPPAEPLPPPPPKPRPLTAIEELLHLRPADAGH